jgi:hypothetical protein
MNIWSFILRSCLSQTEKVHCPVYFVLISLILCVCILEEGFFLLSESTVLLCLEISNVIMVLTTDMWNI